MESAFTTLQTDDFVKRSTEIITNSPVPTKRGRKSIEGLQLTTWLVCKTPTNRAATSARVQT